MKLTFEQLETRIVLSTVNPILEASFTKLLGDVGNVSPTVFKAEQAKVASQILADFSSSKFANYPDEAGKSTFTVGTPQQQLQHLEDDFTLALAMVGNKGAQRQIDTVRTERSALMHMVNHFSTVQRADTTVTTTEVDSVISSVVVPSSQVSTYDTGPGTQVLGMYTDLNSMTTIWIATYTPLSYLPDPGPIGVAAPPPGSGTNGADSDSPGSAQPPPIIGVSSSNGSSWVASSYVGYYSDGTVASSWTNPNQPTVSTVSTLDSYKALLAHMAAIATTQEAKARLAQMTAAVTTPIYGYVR